MASLALYLLSAFIAAGLWLYNVLFVCPSHLHHLPQVPLGPLLYSYLSGETEERRIKRLFLPFANRNGQHLVVVWVFGNWYVHVLSGKLGKQLMDNKAAKKQQPPKEMLFWRFTGLRNIFLTEGEEWRRHSSIVHSALHRRVPIDQFCDLSRTLFSIMREGGRQCWSDFTSRFTLDAMATNVIGYDFEALQKPDGPFVHLYHEVMEEMANPLYVIIPRLEVWFPRVELSRKVDQLLASFEDVLERKRHLPGNDFITYMFEDPTMTAQERRDNIIVLFMGGHDTTAGALSSLIYWFALYPDMQERARQEVVSVIGDRDPVLSDFERMPFLWAAIREAMRISSPTNITIPRISDEPIHLSDRIIPPNVPIVLNLCALLHNNDAYQDEAVFDPERFLFEADEGKWMVFGSGPRQCPARNFALYEQRTLASLLLREYKWSLPEDSIHRDGLKTSLSTFALSLAKDLYIDFQHLGKFA